MLVHFAKYQIGVKAQIFCPFMFCLAKSYYDSACDDDKDNDDVTICFSQFLLEAFLF